MNPIKITQHPSNNQLLYFTSSSLLADDSGLIFLSDRTGNPNIFYMDFKSGNEKQLTFNEDGYLKSYVYFYGNEYKGLGKASISLHEESGTIYYLQGRKICKVDITGKQDILAELPNSQMTAFTHISADGTRLCVPTTDARALEGITPDNFSSTNIDKRVQDEELNSYLRTYNTISGEELKVEKVPKSWITHVQFCPLNSDLILYNHEWPSNCGIRRMWLWNGSTHIRIRTENENRSREDWTCHEMWQKDGTEIIYHGKYKDGISYIGKVGAYGEDLVEIKMPPEYIKYGHFTVSPQGLLVSDGYYQLPSENKAGCGEWISIQKIDWVNGKLQWIPLCKHGSNWDSQDSHPHPIFSHSGTSVFYTSNIDGNRAIYRIDI